MTTSQQIMCLEYKIHCLREFDKLLDSLLYKASTSDGNGNGTVKRVLGNDLWDDIWGAFQSVLESRQQLK